MPHPRIFEVRYIFLISIQPESSSELVVKTTFQERCESRLTLRQFCDLESVHPSTVTQLWEGQGHAPKLIREGQRIFIRQRDYAAWLRRRDRQRLGKSHLRAPVARRSAPSSLGRDFVTVEYFGSSPKKGRGMARQSRELIDAMRTAAERAHPITGRGIGYKLFTAGLIPSMSVKDMKRVYRLLLIAREQGVILGPGLLTKRAIWNGWGPGLILLSMPRLLRGHTGATSGSSSPSAA